MRLLESFSMSQLAFIMVQLAPAGRCGNYTIWMQRVLSHSNDLTIWLYLCDYVYKTYIYIFSFTPPYIYSPSAHEPCWALSTKIGRFQILRGNNQASVTEMNWNLNWKMNWTEILFSLQEKHLRYKRLVQKLYGRSNLNIKELSTVILLH